MVRDSFFGFSGGLSRRRDGACDILCVQLKVGQLAAHGVGRALPRRHFLLVGRLHKHGRVRPSIGWMSYFTTVSYDAFHCDRRGPSNMPYAASACANSGERSTRSRSGHQR